MNGVHLGMRHNIVLKSISFKTSRPSSPATFSHALPTGSWLACPSTQIDLRSSADPMGVINDPWQGSHSKAKQNCHEKMLLERNDVSDFEHF